MNVTAVCLLLVFVEGPIDLIKNRKDRSEHLVWYITGLLTLPFTYVPMLALHIMEIYKLDTFRDFFVACHKKEFDISLSLIGKQDAS
jgi:hypothetical protein